MLVDLVKFTLQGQHNINHVSLVYLFRWFFRYAAIFKTNSYEIRKNSCKVEIKILLHYQWRPYATVLQEEIVLIPKLTWCLDVVQGKYFFRLSDSNSKRFACKFPDSKFAKEFSCGWIKCSSIITYSVAPHFKKILVEDFNKMDKSYNDIHQYDLSNTG